MPAVDLVASVFEPAPEAAAVDACSDSAAPANAARSGSKVELEAADFFFAGFDDADALDLEVRGVRRLVATVVADLGTDSIVLSSRGYEGAREDLGETPAVTLSACHATLMRIKCHLVLSTMTRH